VSRSVAGYFLILSL